MSTAISYTSDYKTVSDESTELRGISCECDNPVCVHKIGDNERAKLLREYIDSLPVNPRLMPRTKDGKKPLIQEKEIALDSDKGRDLLVKPQEAIRRIREEGANGFCLYAGKPTHNTRELVFADHDDMDKFPLETLPETLTVRSGSGDGCHETFTNGGDVTNAVGKDQYDGAGEIRADNWLVVTPGSIHPSGGIYHTTHFNQIETLHEEDIPQGLKKRQRINTNTESLSESDLETVSKDINHSTVEIAERYLNEWKSHNLSAFYCLYDRLRGGRGDYGTEFDNDSNQIDRDLQEKTILTHIYGVYRDLGYSDSRAKELAYQLLTHYSVECNSGNTKDGRPRKWLVRSEDYKAQQLRYAAIQFDRIKFEKWCNKSTKSVTKHKRVNNEYGEPTRGIALFAVDILCGVHSEMETHELRNQLSPCYGFTLSEDELKAVRSVIQRDHMYNDIPRPLGDEVLKEEDFYPKKSDVSDLCKRIDGVYKGNKTSSFDKCLQRLQQKGYIKLACLKEGVDYRVYPSGYPDPVEAEHIRHNGEKYEVN